MARYDSAWANDKAGASGVNEAAARSLEAGRRRGAETEARYQALSGEAAAYGLSAEEAIQGGRGEAARSSRDLSGALLGLSAGRNPMAAQQATLQAGQQRAAGMAQARSEAADFRSQQAVAETTVATERADALTPEQLAHDELYASGEDGPAGAMVKYDKISGENMPAGYMNVPGHNTRVIELLETLLRTSVTQPISVAKVANLLKAWRIKRKTGVSLTQAKAMAVQQGWYGEDPAYGWHGEDLGSGVA